MAAATILMAILGCGDAGTACEQVAVSPISYASVSECVAAQDEVLARSDVMFPVVTAQCRPAASALSASAPKPATKWPTTKRLLLKSAALRS